MGRQHHRYEILIFVAALSLLLASIVAPQTSQAAPTASAAVQRAWQRAQEVGVYHFTTEINQTTYPAPALTNAGDSRKTETLYLEGRVNTPESQMTLLLRPEGGSALSLQDSFEVRIEGDQTYGREPGGEWRELRDFSGAFAPAGDLLAYLAGAENVRPVEENRYRYEIDGPEFAAYIRDQMERHLVEAGELPPSIRLESSEIYRDVTGDGEVWVGADGLPNRLAVNLTYPPAADGERVHAQVTTDFFGFPKTTGSAQQRYAPSWAPQTPGGWQELAQQLGMILGTVGFIAVLVLRRRSRALYIAVVAVLVFSMIAAPVIDSVKAAAFFTHQTAQQAQQEADRSTQEAAEAAQARFEGPAWDPQRDPLSAPAAETERPYAPTDLSAGSEASSEPAHDLCTAEEKTADTDEDGLTDCQEHTQYLTNPKHSDSDGDSLLDGWEVLRLGSLPTAADSDGDGIGDGLEVTGFDYRDQRWYSDPNSADSDSDGRPDGIECPGRLNIDTDDAVDPTTPCVDTDDDGIPDLFDLDSDGDSVPDSLDLSPLTSRGQETPFDRNTPFQLLVDNLQPRPDGEGSYFPTLIDFQLRPENPEHLTYAMNVLDWPSGDEKGQIQRFRGNDSSFADAMTPEEGASDPRAANGDLRLIPMLEIEMSGPNLPMPLTQAQTTLSWENHFNFDLTLTQQEGGIKATLSDAADAAQTYGFQVYEGVCGDLGAPIGQRFSLSTESATSLRTDLDALVDVADGEHVIMADNGTGTSAVRACLPLGDLPNGNSSTQMIDTEPLQAYGMSVRDKNNDGTVLIYTPLNVVPDETGGGRTAFSARIFFQPQAANLGDAAQQVRVVWMVQALTDWCKPAPADAPEPIAETWCQFPQNWEFDHPQIVHSYYEDWYLTGLSVREDHGLNVAVAWEDPATETAEERQAESWLWILARGLNRAFVSGRDQDEDGVRDVGVATETAGLTLSESTIAQRFGTPPASGITAEQRFGIPLTATLGVETFTYPDQDHVAHVMMTESQRILEENFSGYPEATPTLLFAREELYRSVGLSDIVPGDQGATLDFAEEAVNVLAALSWSPYRFREGTWEGYPIAEYWDHLGAVLGESFRPDTTLPEEMREDVIAGEIYLARAYYLTLNQGQINQVQMDDIPLGGQGQSDEALAADAAFMISAFLIQMLADQLAADLVDVAVTDASASPQVDSPTGRITKAKQFTAKLGRGFKFGVSKLPALLNKVKTTLTTKAGLAGAAGVGALLGVAAALVSGLSLAGLVDAVVMVEVVITSVIAATMVYTLIMSFKDLLRPQTQAAQSAATTAGAATANAARQVGRQAQTISRAAMVCAVIGLIIGIVVAFAGMLTTIFAGHHKAFSLAANAAFAEAIAYTVVAVLMFAISMIPVVGQIIVAVIAAVDALIAAACAIGTAVAGEDVSQRPGGFFCKGISGLAAEAFKQLIYSSTVLVDLTDEDRLTFGSIDYALPNPELGLSAGNPVEYGAELTNTIELVSVVAASDEMKEDWESGNIPFPAEWKSMSYWWQFKDENAKKSTFDYRWQTEEEDLEGVDFDSMSDAWQPTNEAHTFSFTANPTSAPIPLGQAGLNQRPTLFLSEGYDVPVQECFAYPSGPQCGVVPYLPYACLVPICYVRHKEGTNHLDLGDRFIVDVFPATLDEFYQATGKDGGYSPAWAQTPSEASGGTVRFPVQPDFDGDTLLAQVKGGADPDDGQWDTDGDGLNDAFEYQNGSDPTLYDTDGDGLNDAEELRAGTDLRRQDTDGDGLTDGEELQGWEIAYAFDENGEPLRTAVTSDPLVVDADNDTLTDFKERTYGFNPNCPSEPHILEMASAAREGDAPRLLLRFDDAAGSETFADASGYGKTATCASDFGAGCPVSTGGRYVTGQHFDGEDALRVPHSELNALRNDLTIAAWIRTDDPSEWQTIAATARTESDNGFHFSIVNDNLQFTTYGVNTYSLSNANLPSGQWTHVAAVMGVDNAVTFYVNGVARGTESYPHPAHADTDDALLIGASTFPYGQRLFHPFKGDLDEVAVFDRALNADEVARLVEARYDFNDLIVQPGATLAYTSTLTNKLYDRYAQGLHSITSPQAGALSQTPPQQTFVLQPMEGATLAGEAQVAETTASGAFTLTQRARAQVTDWREASNFAALWLPLNEGSGATTFTDHSGNVPPRDAICAEGSCPTPQAPGYFDYALSFDGNETLTLPTADRLGFKDSSFSVSAWIRGSDFPSSGGATNDRAILGTDGNTATALQLVVRETRPTLSFGGQTLSADVTLTEQTWYHVVFRYDAYLGEQAIYVNGELQGTQTGAAPFTGTGAVYLGRARGACTESGVCFQGTLDDVRTFARALTLDEIRALYNRPVLRYPFEEINPSATRMTVDASGFGNAAHCDFGACPSPASGVYGQRAVHFTGDTYFDVAGTPSLNLDEGHFTIATWVWPDTPSSDVDRVQGILGRYRGTGDPTVEGPGDRVANSYPTLFNVGGRLRFGYGTGAKWVTRTTSDTVLTEESWNHVVLSFGPESTGDGPQQYRAVLYVNNAVVGDWVMGEAPPLAGETDFFVGRASNRAQFHIDRFEVVDEADGPGDCEIYLKWQDTRIDRWGGLGDDDVVDVDHTRLFSESGMLYAWEDDAGANDDDPLCDINASNCEGKGHSFNTNEPSYDHKVLDWQGDDSEGIVGRDNTHIKITLGDDGTPAFFNPSIPFQGRMDEVTMYKRPLSAAEVQELYFAASMAMRLPFDDPPGSETFQDTVDVSLQGGAYCSGEACPTAGINGRENQAAHFDGVDDVVQTDLQLDQSASGGGATLTAWVRPASTSSGAHAVIRNDDYGWSLVRVGADWQVYDGKGRAAVTAPVDKGQWQHLAAVFDPQTGLTLYKNGIAVNDTPAPVYTRSNSAPLTLGQDFDGAMDDVRVFNRPLVSDDIETLYQRVPILQLHLDEPHADAPPFYDTAGGLEATCEADRCPLAGLNGQVGLAAGFNLEADARTAPLSIEHRSDLETETFTLGAWVLPTTMKGTRQLLVDNGSNASLYIPADSLNATVAYRHSGGEQTASSVTPLVMNQWNHVMGTHDGERLRIYVNGYPQGSKPATQRPVINTDPLLVGSEAFAGRLDEVTLYSRALAPDEVRNIFRYQGKLVEMQSGTWITVDDEPPASTLRSYSADRPYITPEGVALHVEARDATSGISLLELGVDGDYTAAPRCTDATGVPTGAAEGASAWCPYFDPTAEGTYQLSTRATDFVGHREAPMRTYTLHVDGTAPQVRPALSDGELVAATRHPTRQGHWVASLQGTLTDPALPGGAPGSGVDPEAVFVTLTGPEGTILGAARQQATFAGNTWSADYLFTGAQPTGRYTVTIGAADRLGNATSETFPARLHLDATAPAPDLDARAGMPMDGAQPFEGLVSELPLPRNTLLALRFEEGMNETTFYDSSGAQRHGTCRGGTCPTSGSIGHSGHAVRFDGVDDAILLSPETATAINALRNDLSVAAWIHPVTLSGEQWVVASGSHDGFAFGLQDGDLLFKTFNVHEYRLTDPELQTGQWTHVAATIDKKNNVTFYLDGVAQGTVSHDQPVQTDPYDRFFVGADERGGTFNGLLDDVVVVGRALGADEVRALAQQRMVGVSAVDTAFRPVLPGSPFHNPSQPDAAVLHLPLDDTSSANHVDNVYFRDLTQGGAAAACTGGACPDLDEPGRVGNAVLFDGEEDTLALSNFGVFTTTTVATWVRRSDGTAARQTVLAYKEKADCGFALALDGADAQPYAAFNVEGTWATVKDAASAPAATWVHLAASYDGTTLRLYRDGDLVGETTAAGALAQCTADSAVGSNAAGNADFFAGALDDVRVYRLALSGAEIETLYLGTDPLLALPFNLDQGWATDGTMLSDASTWDHAVTLHTGDLVNKTVAGQEGAYALAFDGDNDYAAVKSAPSLAMDTDTPAFTQAAWIHVEPQDGGTAPADLNPIFSSAAYDTPETQYPFLQVIDRDKVVAGFGDGTTLQAFTTGSVLTPGDWQHVAGVFDGQTYTLYIDGEPVETTDQFAGLRPASAARFDVGRGARAEALGCATFDEVTLTGETWEQQWRVRYQGEIIYESPVYPTVGRPYALPLQTAYCGAVPFEVEARYWDTATGWNWTPLGTFDLTPTPGERSHTFSAGGRSSTLTWRTTTPQSDLRYFRGRLDAVQLYPRALSPLDVQHLYEGHWQPAELAEHGDDVDVTAWRAEAPAGLEGSYEVDARGWDLAGHANTTGLSQRLWSGELDTLAPRLTITRTAAGDRYHYETVAEDYNLVRDGFSSPCGAGVGEGEPFGAAWYQTLSSSAPGRERLHRLTAECDTPATGLFQAGAWTEQPWITGQPAVVTGTDETVAYVPAGRLWQLDVSDPARPRLTDIYPAVENAQNVTLDETHAYVSEGTRGLSVLPLADPSAPAARYDTPGEAVDAALAGDYVVVADGNGGLRVLDARDPTHPVEGGYLATGGDARGVAISEMPMVAMTGSGGRGVPAPLVSPTADALSPVISEVTTRSPTSVSTPTLMSADLSPQAWASIQKQIEAVDYALTWDEASGAFISHDRANAWTTSLSDAGVSVNPSDEDWTWQLALAGYGAGDQVQAVARATESMQDGKRVTFQRDRGLTEWYTHDARGIEQGFTLAQPPVSGSDAPIRLRMALTTTLTATAADDGQVVLFRDADGHIVLRYAELHAFDATGRTLPARLTLDGPRAIVLTVDAADAVYPITIDPLLTRFSRQLTAFDGQADAQFSSAIAVDGDTLAVGAPWITGTVAEAGAVYLFKQHESGPDQWGLVKKITATNGLAGDRFGSALALANDWLAVGAPYASVGGNAEQGAAYVFKRNEGGADAWGQVRVFSDTQGASGDHFGATLDLALAGGRLVVGAPQADSGALVDTGAVYVFALVPTLPAYTLGWDQMSVITATDGAAGDEFGAAVAMDGLTLVAGAPQANATLGATYVYTQNQDGTEAWTQVKVLTATDGVVGDQFGAAVDIRNDTIVVGAPLAEISGQVEQGAAYLFDRTLGGVNAWGLRKKVSIASGAAGDRFATAVALKSDVLLAGAPNGAGGQGTAYLFVQNRGGPDAWGLARVFTATASQLGAAFGRALALDGHSIAVGAPLHDLAATDEGALFLFSRTGQVWVEQTQLSVPGAVNTGNNSTAMNGDFLAVGAPDALVNGDQIGAVHLFQRNLGGTDQWGLVKRITAESVPNRAAGDLFGTAVAFAGETLIVGAPGFIGDQGAVFLFDRDQGGPDNWGETTIAEWHYGDADGDRYGQTLAASESWFLVGAPYRDSIWPDEGIVRLYARVPSESDGWALVHNTRGITNTRLSSAMASSGGVVAVAEGSGGVRVGVIQESEYSSLPWHDLSLSIGAQASSAGWGQALALAGDVLFVYDADTSFSQSPFHIFYRNEGGPDSWDRVKTFGTRGETVEHVAAGPDLIALQSLPNEVQLYGRNEGGPDNWGVLPPLELGADFSGVAAMKIFGDTLVIHETDTPTHTVHLYQLAARPVGYPDAYTTNEDQTLPVVAPGVLTNDEPTEGSTLTVTVDTPPAHGTVTLNATGAFTYTPAPYYYGPDAFTYRANDGVLDSLPTTVTLTITPVNDPPVAHADVYTPTEDSVFTVAAPGVLTNDDDVENDPLTATVNLTPAHGTLALNADGGFQYTPAPDFDGIDTFTYHANDGEFDSNTVTVTLNVAPVNDAPVAQDDAYTTPEDVLLNVAAPGVLGNDKDVDGDTLHATVEQTPTVGALTLAGSGALLYEPALNDSGVTTFTYRIDDGTLQDTATVTLTVTAVDDPPHTQSDSYTTDLDTPLTVGAPDGLLANDYDAEGATLQATLATSPTHGSADVAPSGAFVYTPTLSFFGLDTFTYHAFDGTPYESGVLSTTTTVTLTVNGPPTAEDVAVFTQEEISTTLSLIPDHTSDPEGDILSVTAVGTPITGTTALSGTTGVLYTPATHFTGDETFTYTVADPRGLTASARITVTVGGVNDAPVAVDDNVETPEDQPLNVPVLDNDYDPDGQTPQLLTVGAPEAGDTRIAGDAVTYTPTPDFHGTDLFTYTIGDGILTATAHVTLTVTSLNDPPTLDRVEDVALEPGSGEHVITLSGIGTGADNESQPLDVTATSSDPMLVPDPTVSYDGASTTGELRFTPTTGMTGTATVSVTVSDGLSKTLRAFDVTVWDATGPFAYVAAGEAGLLVVDLSHPETPRQIARLQTPGTAQDVTLAGDTAYVAAGAAGLLVVDVSTPIQPALLASVATPGFAGSASAVNDQVFVADGYTGVAQVDASDRNAPTLISSSDTPGFASRLTAVGQTLYVADSNGGLRTFDTEVPPGQATACDRAGNCTTAEATAIQTMNMTAEALHPLTTGIRILNAPPILMDTAPLTVTGKAFAAPSTLKAMTLTLDHHTLFTQSWASGVVSTTLWNAPWDPAGLSDGPHRLYAELATWDDRHISDTLTVTLDTTAPQLAIATTVLTHAHYRAGGAVVLEGPVVDDGGVAAVDLISDGETRAATVEGRTWEAPWYLPSDTLPDGETFTVTVQATDIAGHVKGITPTLRVDVTPPTAPTLTLRSGGDDLTAGTTVRELSPTLTLDWTASQDGSGPVNYSVEWLATVNGVQRTVTRSPDPTRQATYTAPEASKVTVRLGAQDPHGHERWQHVGPVYVDGPRTPDYVGDSPYRGWMESGCTLLGTDRRIRRDALDTGTLDNEQRLYVTWNADALRLAWTGANWGSQAASGTATPEPGDGDLFIYLDTGPGGSTTAFDPYGTERTTLHMPGVTPTQTVGAMAADALVWVRDAETALLLRWQDAEGRWQIQGPLSDAEYQYDAEVNGGQTDLLLPFDRIDLTPESSLDLVAFAADEGVLDLWATLPNANPLSSDKVVETATRAEGNAHFALLHTYHWDRVGAGVCPNGSNGSSPAYPDTELQAQLSASPKGIAYSLVDSELFWLWEQLTGEKPADVSSFFNLMSTEHPKVGANQSVTYTLRYRNAGTDPATGLYAEVTSHYALRLTPGDTQLRLTLGDLAPGEEKVVSFQGKIDLARGAEPWSAVTVALYDDAHPPDGAPVERFWLDHQVDREEPEFVGITSPAYVLSAGTNRVHGYVYDDSPVPMVTLNLEDGRTVDCPDATPTDGSWTCSLDATAYDDGDVITARAEAVDTFGQRSEPSAPRQWVVDTLPPTATLTIPAEGTGLLLAGNTQLSGNLIDNHGLAGAEVCLGETCTAATVALSGTVKSRTYDDTPNTPIAITGGACATGSGIARTFSVTESFTVGSVRVGFRAEHPHRDDLDVTLTSPSGLNVPLLTDDGVSGTAFRHYNVLLDDQATGAYAARHNDVITQSVARQARPATPLAGFAGEEAAGSWRLTICDRDPASNDGAYMDSQLHLSPAPGQMTARAGTWSYTFQPERSLDYVTQELSVVGIDLAGNRTDDPLQLTLIADNVAPTITVTHLITRATFTQSLEALSGTFYDGSLTATDDASIQVSVLVKGPGGVYNEPATREGTDWHYILEPSTPGRYEISVSAYDRVGNVSTAGPFTVEVHPQTSVYMPLITRRFVEAPDLVVERLDAGPQGARVVIANRSDTRVADSFWVDLYIDPTTRPFEVNEIWNQVGSQGAVWGVTTPLEAGEVLTLTIGDRLYHAAYSSIRWPLPVGAPVYAHVDSAGDPAYGGVLEYHEVLAWGYNNIMGATVGDTTPASSRAVQRTLPWNTKRNSLPSRR